MTNTTLVLENSLFGIMGIIFMIFFAIWTIWVYNKARRWIIIFINFIFSIIFGFVSFQYDIILSPYPQIFIILLNGILFMMVSIQAFEGKVN